MFEAILTLLHRFRWVFCQLETLQHCFPSNLRRFLNELPETLDETYERMLRCINKAQKDDAYRLLQCLTVASRPLHVKELAELLAFDFDASSSGGIPKLREDWRWNDEEEAVLSTCSSLISIIHDGDSRVVQFSHFSVKEYHTSPRLAQSSHVDVLRFHIDLEPAHTIMAQACLAILLQPDGHVENNAKWSPLLKYAAQHWVDHAKFEKVSSRVRDGVDDLFDTTKPHFAAWLQVHDMDESWSFFHRQESRGVGSPLYYAALCGFYDLSERLIMRHPEQVNARGGHIVAPLPAALSKRHFDVAKLLYRHGAVVDVQDSQAHTPLHVASEHNNVDVMRWLLDRGADPNARSSGGGWTPLYHAACSMDLECLQVLLERKADINSQDGEGETPLLYFLYFKGTFRSPEGMMVDIVRRLLEHGADPNIRDHRHSTTLHQTSSLGWLEVTRLLLNYGAKIDEKDVGGRTPFQLAASKGHHEIAKLLLDHGAVPQP